MTTVYDCDWRYNNQSSVSLPTWVFCLREIRLYCLPIVTDTDRPPIYLQGIWEPSCDPQQTFLVVFSLIDLYLCPVYIRCILFSYHEILYKLKYFQSEKLEKQKVKEYLITFGEPCVDSWSQPLNDRTSPRCTPPTLLLKLVSRE